MPECPLFQQHTLIVIPACRLLYSCRARECIYLGLGAMCCAPGCKHTRPPVCRKHTVLAPAAAHTACWLSAAASTRYSACVCFLLFACSCLLPSTFRAAPHLVLAVGHCMGHGSTWPALAPTQGGCPTRRDLHGCSCSGTCVCPKHLHWRANLCGGPPPWLAPCASNNTTAIMRARRPHTSLTTAGFALRMLDCVCRHHTRGGCVLRLAPIPTSRLLPASSSRRCPSQLLWLRVDRLVCLSPVPIPLPLAVHFKALPSCSVLVAVDPVTLRSKTWWGLLAGLSVLALGQRRTLFCLMLCVSSRRSKPCVDAATSCWSQCRSTSQ
jgi:hypothetical protein